MRCPRCNARVGYRTGDPDTFGCYSCGEIPHVAPLGSPNAASEHRCPHCNAGVLRKGTMCRTCAQRRQQGSAKQAKQTKHRGAPIVITPSHSMGFVTSKKGTGF